MKSSVEHIRMGNSIVRFNHYGDESAEQLLIRLHGDEYDASDVGVWWVKHHGQAFLDIENDTREVYLDFNHELYAFDPNRMFSETGITRSLNEFAPDNPPEVIAEIDKLSRFITRKLRKYQRIIALHNNEDFNIQYYLPGGESHDSAKSVHIDSQSHPHDFVIVTYEEDFLALKQRGCNVVLEHLAHNDQPGSLSEYCLQHNIRYINIETKKGRGKTQKELLKLVMTSGIVHTTP